MNQEEQYKQNLSQSRLEQLKEKAGEMALSAAGAPAPIAKQIVKHRRTIFWIIAALVIFIFSIFALSFLSIWGYYCNNTAARTVLNIFGDIKITCP